MGSDEWRASVKEYMSAEIFRQFRAQTFGVSETPKVCTQRDAERMT